MSQGVVSILNPMSAEAMAVILGRRAFLREIVIAALLALSEPLVCLVGVYVYLLSSGENLLGIAVGTITAGAVIAGPLLFYASFRLNAATLARERTIFGTAEQQTHPPMKGPILLRASMVAGSTRSRILAGFPLCLGFGLVFAIMSYMTADTLHMVLYVPLGVMLVVQAAIAMNLLQ